MISVLFAAVLLKSDTPILDKSGNRIGVIEVAADKLAQPKLSPRQFGTPSTRWEFGWKITVEAETPNGLSPRFQVFSQDEKTATELAPKVGRMLLRLWNLNYNKLGLEHSSEYGGRVLQVYLCQGGTAGGEQLIDVDPDTRQRAKVNTIYIYDIASFSDPVEMAREVAHEYGHASLPAIGGYQEPEYWANGYLGERFFLKSVSDAMTAGEMTAEDSMGASSTQIQKWLALNVDPLVSKAAQEGPNLKVLAGTSKQSMDSYMGMALCTASLLPTSVFSRSIQLVSSTSAKDYPEAVAMAAEEPAKYTVLIPKYLAHKNIWLPIGQGSLKGGQVIQKKGAWVLVKPTTGPLIVIPKQSI